MPYLWKIPDEYPEELIGEYLREQSPNRFLLRQGKIFTDHNLTPTFRFNGSLEVLEGFDILPNSTMIPLVSERVANLLIALCASDLQFIPATVMVGDEEILGYSLLNALKFISGIDHLHSEYVLFPGTKQIMGFNRLSYNTQALGVHHIARESEYASFLFVSETVRQAFSAEGWKGYSFIQPEQIAW